MRVPLIRGVNRWGPLIRGVNRRGPLPGGVNTGACGAREPASSREGHGEGGAVHCLRSGVPSAGGLSWGPRLLCLCSRPQALPGQGSASLAAQVVKNLPAQQEGWVCGLGLSPGESMTTCCGVLAWDILWAQEPGGSQCAGGTESDMTGR